MFDAPASRNDIALACSLVEALCADDRVLQACSCGHSQIVSRLRAFTFRASSGDKQQIEFRSFVESLKDKPFPVTAAMPPTAETLVPKLFNLGAPKAPRQQVPLMSTFQTSLCSCGYTKHLLHLPSPGICAVCLAGLVEQRHLLRQGCALSFGYFPQVIDFIL